MAGKKACQVCGTEVAAKELAKASWKMPEGPKVLVDMCQTCVKKMLIGLTAQP